MANKRRTALRKINVSKNKQEEIYKLILASFIITAIMIVFVAFLSATAYRNEQNEINSIQQSLLPKPLVINPVLETYEIHIAPSINGEVCTATVNNTCILREAGAKQVNIFDMNITYSGTYTMDVFINPPAKVSLKMIINYENQTENIVTYKNLSGLTVFSGPQVPSHLEMIFSNEGNTTATGYLRITEMPK